jgi:hypothetical protein
MMAAKRGGMEGIGALLSRAYPGRSKEEVEAIQVFGAFMRALSPRIVKNARPVRLHKGILTVHTVTSAWANTLQLESQALLTLIKRVSPKARVSKMVFRVGELPNAAAPVARDEEPERSLPVSELPEEIARELARIHPDKLREAVARAAAAGLGEMAPPKRKRRAPGDL